MKERVSELPGVLCLNLTSAFTSLPSESRLQQGEEARLRVLHEE